MSNHQQNPPLSYGDDPEEFYRPASTVADTHNSSTTSPANSDAPIMKWPTSKQPDFRLAPAGPESPHSPPQPQYAHTSYSPPPPIPEVHNYRTSMGVVNGEIGGATYGEAYGAPMRTPTTIAPLSAGLKTPMTHTVEEQHDFSKIDEKVFKDNQRDLAVKLKIRLVKVVLRGVNCACSLVVLSLIASTFAIFNATRHLPERNGLTPWATSTPKWPQITVLCIACISLAMSLSIMYFYWKGGHKRAAKAAFYATIFAAGGFIFSIAMWGVSIGIMQGSRATQASQDLWGWSCKDNNLRRKLFQDTVNYKLVCRQNDWVVVCAIIEIVVESISIAVYVFAFYRFHTKHQLRKSMNVRDEARSSLWLAKLKEQQATEADHETSVNTAYNQINSNSSDVYVAAEEARAVPILQPPPPGHHANTSVQDRRQSKDDVAAPPPAMFRRDSLVPATPRSVSFQPTPPRLSEQ